MIIARASPGASHSSSSPDWSSRTMPRRFISPASTATAVLVIDQPSIGIPYLYIATGLELSDALAQSNPAEAQKVLDTARQVANRRWNRSCCARRRAS